MTTFLSYRRRRRETTLKAAVSRVNYKYAHSFFRVDFQSDALYCYLVLSKEMTEINLVMKAWMKVIILHLNSSFYFRYIFPRRFRW